MSSKRQQTVVYADAYLGMKLGKALQAEQSLRKKGWKTKLVKRDERYGEERYAIQVTFKTTGFEKGD